VPAGYDFGRVAHGVKPVDVGVTIGQVFLGKYRVDAILGHGGMGVVAECTHLALNERVAIKMLRPDVLLDQDAVERFQREARAAAKLKSEYVARVSDVGQFETGVPYMVMEFLEGLDLDQLLEERGVLPVPWGVELVLQTAEALAEAHSHGIVHRDVKPSNLFVTWRPDGTALIKVLDFGISKSPMGTDMQLTQTQSLLGTPSYMSPEQMRSARLVDARTDIWSLGTVLYELLEGHKPFEAESFSEMCVKVAVDPPAPMVRIPHQLQPIVLRCLAKAPEQRFANMAELGRELVPFAQDPHQAAVLVDRMGRVLRRAAGDFSGDTSVSGRVMQSARDAAGVPLRAATPQPWGLGSDPSAQAWHGGSQPAPMAPMPPVVSQAVASDRSQPYPRAPHEFQVDTLAVRRARRRWPLVLALAIPAVVAGAIVLALVTSDDDAPTTQAEGQVPAAPSAGPATAVPPAAPAPATAAVVAPAPTSPAGSGSGSASTPPGSDAGSSATQGTSKHNATSTQRPHQASTKQATPNAPSSTTKKPDETKGVLPATAPVEPKEDCDPFASFTGRPSPAGCKEKQ
jgi:tRNA A-37 threonylcarbamoyl transferase component Bud32